MIELFKHIIHLDFEWIFAQYGFWIYLILFLVIFIETGLVAMPFLPGDSLLFTAGLFARTGYLDYVTLLLLLFLAAVLGDNSNYWIGRTIGLKVFQYHFRGKPLVKKAYLDQTHDFFEKYGKGAVILARFVPFVRTFAPFSAGVGRMNYKIYLLFDILGGAIWIFSLTTAGYLLGEITWIRKNIDLVCIGIVLLSVMPILVKVYKLKSSAKRN